MRVLISASSAAPRFEGQQLLSAARSLGLDAELFDHRVSRDPTLELPELARRLRPERVLLVAPEREDPGTVDLLRRLGAAVAAWIPAPAEGAPAWLRARRRWIAQATDAVAVTDPELVEAFHDRNARPALLLPRGFDARFLGITLSPPAPPETAPAPTDLVAVRGRDDPLLIAAPLPARSITVHGDPPRVRGVRYAGPIATAPRLVELLRGRGYLTGARRWPGPPGIFDDAAAAAAMGAAVIEVPFMGVIDAGSARLYNVGEAALDARLQTLESWIQGRRDA